MTHTIGSTSKPYSGNGRRRHGICEQTLYRWKAKYSGMQVSDVRRLKQLEEENRKLKQLLAEATLDNQALREILAKNW